MALLDASGSGSLTGYNQRIIRVCHPCKAWLQEDLVHKQSYWQTSRAWWLPAGDISFLPHGLLHWAAHNMTAVFPQSQQVREPKTVPKIEATVFL